MDTFSEILADVKRKRLQSALALARPLAVEVDDQLMRLPKLLPYAADHPELIQQITEALSELRAGLMEFERAIVEAHPAVQARAA